MIFNTITAGGTVPDYIWVEYNITRHDSGEWNSPKQVMDSDRFSHEYTSTTQYAFDMYSSYSFNAANGTFSVSGLIETRVDEIPQDSTLYKTGWILTKNDQHYVYHVTHVTRSPYTYWFWYDYYFKSTERYTVSYDSVRAFYLSERTGEEYKKYPLYK